jgi:CRISPR-associated protein Csb2
LEALINRHEAFLGRVQERHLAPLPALSAFDVVGYCRETDPPTRPFAAFEIWKPVHELAELPAGRSKFRPFDPVRHSATVAGMVRDAVGEAAVLSRPGDTVWRDTFVLGHGDGTDGQATTDRRFAFLPLPSLERRGPREGARTNHVGMIRRVLVVGPDGAAAEVEWVRRALSGRELTTPGTGRPMAVLSIIPSGDPNVAPYTRPSAVWSTVTPVILPGYDDGRPKKTEHLLRKAIEQAGFPPRLARHAAVEWRNVGFLPGLDLASRYTAAPHHWGSRYHVRIAWRDASGRAVPVRGPVAIGGGRYYGIGVFAGLG